MSATIARAPRIASGLANDTGLAVDIDALVLAGDDVVLVGSASLETNPSSSSFLVARYEAGDEHRCERGRGERGF